MKTAYFDCVFGISGDMTLGALVSCGMPLDHLKNELGKIHLHGYTLSEEKVHRSGVSSTLVRVDTEHQHEHRHLSHILNLISSSSLPARVKDRASKVFTCLAEAEARVHGTTPEEVHFHEVGAVDAIVDVVGACIGLEYFEVDNIISAPLSLGNGTVRCAHGVMPVPVPAVVELSKGVPTRKTSLQGEITTPTGAAILKALAASWGDLDNFVPETAGYGAGSRIMEDSPNTLRIMIGEVLQSYEEDRCVMLETNIDDMNPEIYGYITSKILEAGAKDVFLSPVYMKKGRPGILVSVLSDEGGYRKLMDLLFSETTTLGIRLTRINRKMLHRTSKTVETEYGPVRVKSAMVNGIERITPEFDDCARIAREKGTPLIEIYNMVNNSVHSKADRPENR